MRQFWWCLLLASGLNFLNACASTTIQVEEPSRLEFPNVTAPLPPGVSSEDVYVTTQRVLVTNGFAIAWESQAAGTLLTSREMTAPARTVQLTSTGGPPGSVDRKVIGLTRYSGAIWVIAGEGQ